MSRQFLTLIISGIIFMCSFQAQEAASQPLETEIRKERGERVLNSLTGGNGLPPHFQQLQKDFPELADLLNRQ